MRVRRGLEHEVHHGGSDDRYVLYAALYHPGLFASEQVEPGSAGVAIGSSSSVVAEDVCALDETATSGGHSGGMADKGTPILIGRGGRALPKVQRRRRGSAAAHGG